MLNAEYGKKATRSTTVTASGRNTVGVSAIGQPQYGFDPNAGPGNNITRATAATARSRSIANAAVPPEQQRRRRSPSSATSATRRRSTTTAVPILARRRLHPHLRGRDDRTVWREHQPAAEQSRPAVVSTTSARQENQIQPEAGKRAASTAASPRRSHLTSRALLELRLLRRQARSVDGLPIASKHRAVPTSSRTVWWSRRPLITQLGAAHPDNPYFGTAARLSYQPLNSTRAASAAPIRRRALGARHRWRSRAPSMRLGFRHRRLLVLGIEADRHRHQASMNWRVKNAHC